MAAPELQRGAAAGAAEHRVEVREVVEAGGEGDGGDVQAGLGQLAAHLLHADGVEVGGGGAAGEGGEVPAEGRLRAAAHAHQLGEGDLLAEAVDEVVEHQP